VLCHVGRAKRRCVTAPKAGEEVDVDHDALACAEWRALVVAAHVGIRPCHEAFGFRRLRCLDPFGRIGLQDLLRNRPNEHPPHGGEEVPSGGRVLSATPTPGALSDTARAYGKYCPRIRSPCAQSSFPEPLRDIEQRHLSSNGNDISFISRRQVPDGRPCGNAPMIN
jgi:hypothetical protein